jgi:acyl-coenzyme A thioesterase PaaI-like protein
MPQSIGPTLRKNWQRLSNKPFGKWLFSRMVGKMAPYSGTIGATVQQLDPGHGLITLREHRKVRNHLKSVHAIALVNLAELVSGLTLMNSLPDKTRGILTGIEMQYLKKSRGLLSAESFCDIPKSNGEQEIQVVAEIRNEAGELVAIGKASWKIGPEKLD